MNTNCHCHYPGGHHHQQPARKMTLVTGPLHWPMASGGHWPGHTGAAAFLHCETLYNTHCTGSYIFTKLHCSSELGLVGEGLLCLIVIWFGLVWLGWVHGWQYSRLACPRMRAAFLMASPHTAPVTPLIHNPATQPPFTFSPPASDFPIPCSTNWNSLRKSFIRAFQMVFNVTTKLIIIVNSGHVMMMDSNKSWCFQRQQWGYRR